MNVLLYFACVVLVLPAAGFAVFALMIDMLVQFGFWEICKLLLAPLWDPFGKGAWVLALLLGATGLTVAGFVEQARPFGFGFIALAGAACSIYNLRAYPGIFSFFAILWFLPGLASVALSVYGLIRAAR